MNVLEKCNVTARNIKGAFEVDGYEFKMRPVSVPSVEQFSDDFQNPNCWFLPAEHLLCSV